MHEDTTKTNGFPFDMFQGEFSHQGDNCTFETMLNRFNIKDKILKNISEIVHDIDLKDEKFGRKEAKGIEFPFPKLFGQLANVYIDKYHLDQKRYLDCLAEISSINYQNAKLNPLAQTRNWFMNKSQASLRNSKNNPLVGGLLAISDCSQITDGGAIVVLSSQKYVKKYNTKKECNNKRDI